MRTLKSLALAVLLLCGAVPVFGQTAPTRNPTETAPEHEAIIRAGVELHEKGDYEAAIAKYQEVLAKNPSDVTAMFEMAFSYLSKEDFDKCFETAKKGAEFKSDLLAMFYDLMASSLDAKGQPQQAIDIYKRGIALVPDASQLYYNMAVTYRETLKQPNDARLALQKAAAIEPLHPDVQLLLGQVYQATGYPAPAFLALSTFLLIDPGGKQALPAYGLWRAVLKGGADLAPDAAVMPATPTPNNGMRPPGQSAAPRTDEGDFSGLETQIKPSYNAFMLKLDEGTPEVQALVAQVDQLLGALKTPGSGPAAGSFVNAHYVPFYVELRQRKFVEPFVYWASQRAPVPGVTDWLQANETRVREFLAWASKYSWPTP